jgi:transcriptional regulator with PAS, ATPase and Fis domain
VTHRGRTFTVAPGRSTVIGRSSSCDVFLDDAQVSRRHAVIHLELDGLHIEDLESHNGTRLLAASPSASDDTQTRGPAETRLAPHVRTRLLDDALVQIGTALITVSAPSAPARASRGDIGFVVVDPAMHRVLDLAERVAPTDLTVLVLGESGSGKDVLANYLHRRSPRAPHRLVTLNCGAVPETLIESELFGHEKGAFTGAGATKQGLIEAADRGTLFLDEIGELPPQLQVKLLRVLEDRQVWRVGALEPRTVDVRFVAATNRDLEQQVATGKFREDLYYRLNGIALVVPPLRERPADIVPLAKHFLAEIAAAIGKPTAPLLTPSACDKLSGYGWPGNVRHLKNVVHRALVMASADSIGPDDLELPESATPPPVESITDPERLRDLADDAERRRVVEAIEACAGNQTRAAEMLGITRRVLVRRLEKYKLPRPRRRDDDQ